MIQSAVVAGALQSKPPDSKKKKAASFEAAFEFANRCYRIRDFS
jgi:hypothetical protein